MNRRMLGRAAFALVAAVVVVITQSPAARADTDPPAVVVNANSRGPAMPQLLNGANRIEVNPDEAVLEPGTSTPSPLAVQHTAQAGLRILRWPGGTRANVYDWQAAIGPQASRGCQIGGSNNGTSAPWPLGSSWGPDEAMSFAHQVGATLAMMVPDTISAQDAADLVEYMNAPVGTNPNGGTAWAEVRAQNGHAAPYGVTRWEIGNELDRGNERYWLDREDSHHAMVEYALGGTQHQAGQTAGKGCDFQSSVGSDGTANQQFRAEFPPVVPGSQAVEVGGQQWAPVSTLATAGPADHVYAFDPATGQITFGDGVHGAIPEQGSHVTIDYDSGVHPGVVDFHRAMKQVDPNINVCSAWAPVTAAGGLGGQTFAQLMKATGHQDDYDCVTMHPYTNFGRDFGIPAPSSAQQVHDEYMLGEQDEWGKLSNLIADVQANGKPGAYVAVTEFGALYFGPNQFSTVYPTWAGGMSHVVYMASQWARFADAGLPYALGNDLVAAAATPAGIRSVIGPPPDYAVTAEARTRQMLTPLLDAGGQVVANTVDGNPVITSQDTPLGSSYPALVTAASVDPVGNLNVMVVNRSATSSVTTKVVTAGFQHQEVARVASIAGDSFTDAGATPSVSTQPVGDGTFGHTFPAHSVTWIQLAPRGS